AKTRHHAAPCPARPPYTRDRIKLRYTLIRIPALNRLFSSTFRSEGGGPFESIYIVAEDLRDCAVSRSPKRCPATMPATSSSPAAISASLRPGPLPPSYSGMTFVFAKPLPPETPLRAAIRDAYRLDETEADQRILAAAEIPAEARDRVAATAR